jgi:hypothetical protein
LLLAWRGEIAVGRWIDLGHIQGRVVELSPFEVVVETDAKVRASLPTLLLLVRALETRADPPRAAFEVLVSRTRPVEEIVSEIEGIARPLDPEATAACLAFSEKDVRVRLETRRAPDIHHRLLVALAGSGQAIEVLEAAPLRGDG